MPRTVSVMVSILLVYIVLGGLWYTIPFVIAASTGNNYGFIGFVIALIPLAEIAISMPIGYYSDKGNIKNLALFGAGIIAVVQILFLLNPIMYLIAAMLLGANISFDIAVSTYIFKVIRKKRARYFGYEFSIESVGWIVGPMIGGVIYGLMGRYADAVFNVLLMVIALFIIAKSINYEQAITKRHFIRNLRTRVLEIMKKEKNVADRYMHFLTAFLYFSFVYGFIAYAIWVFVPLLTVVKGANIITGGFLIGLIEIPTLFGGFVWGKAYNGRHKSRIVVVNLIVAIFAVGLTIYLLQFSYYALIFLFFAYAAMAIADVGISSLMLGQERSIGEIFSFAIIGSSFGGVLGAIIAGTSIAQYGFTEIGVVFIALILGFLAYFLTFNRKITNIKADFRKAVDNSYINSQ